MNLNDTNDDKMKYINIYISWKLETELETESLGLKQPEN